jgi:hypothetical protein
MIVKYRKAFFADLANINNFSISLILNLLQK